MYSTFQVRDNQLAMLFTCCRSPGAQYPPYVAVAPAHPALHTKHTEEAWASVMDVNVTGVLRCTQAFLPLLREGDAKGRIVNMSSIVSGCKYYCVCGSEFIVSQATE